MSTTSNKIVHNVDDQSEYELGVSGDDEALYSPSCIDPAREEGRDWVGVVPWGVAGGMSTGATLVWGASAFIGDWAGVDPSSISSTLCT